MTACACCGTTVGPFVRDRDFPRQPVCGAPRRRRDLAPLARIRECLARRAAQDAAVEAAYTLTPVAEDEAA